MTIEKSSNGDKLILAVEGRIDTKTAPELESELNASLEGVSDLTIDLAKVDYISSARLRVLLVAQKCMSHQGTMTVINANDDLMEIFEITGFTDIFTIK